LRTIGGSFTAAPTEWGQGQNPELNSSRLPSRLRVFAVNSFQENKKSRDIFEGGREEEKS
jgi:hypothetical protein